MRSVVRSAEGQPPKARRFRHLTTLGSLVILFVLVFARSLFRRHDGALYTYARWDFDGSYHRILIFVSDCLRHGILPLWNPYNEAGAPYMVNPQNQAWSPVTLIVSLVAGYDHDIAQRQLILTLLFGGVGAYLLAHELWRTRTAAFVSGLCFTFTSAVFSNLQHLDIINSFALLPWLFWTIAKTAADIRWPLPLLAFLLYFLLTAGYPGVNAVALAWLIAFSVYQAVTLFPRGAPRRRYLLRSAAAWILGIALAAVYWIPVAAYRKTFTRGAGLDLDTALSGALTYRHLWGMIFHFLSVNSPVGSDPDRTMTGLYFGVVAIPLVVVALVCTKAPMWKAVATLGLGSLLMSVGGGFFGRIALYAIVPGTAISRFPAADSRTLMVLAGCLLAGEGARLIATDALRARSVATWSYVGLTGILAAGLGLLRPLVYETMTPIVYHDLVIANITAQLVFMGIVLLLLWRGVRGRRLIAGITLALALDVGTAVTADYVFVGAPITHAELLMRVKTYVHEFDPANADVPRIAVGKNYNAPVAAQAFSSKTFYLSGYGGFRLKKFEHLLKVGFADWLTSGRRVVALPTDANPKSFQEFSERMESVDYRILSYQPDTVRYEVHVPRELTLVFNEMYFPGWRATIDGLDTPVTEVAGGLRAIRVSAGSHDVVTTFRPRIFFLSAAISLLALVVLVGWIAWIGLRRRAIEPGVMPTATESSAASA